MNWPKDIYSRDDIRIIKFMREALSRAEDVSPELQARINAKVADLRQRATEVDNRQPLDARRKAFFEMQLADYHPEDHPPEIPEVFSEASCNVFGHICPVFFAAEGATETSEDRRRGRYIPFKTKMRVVRRDHHTCQECGVHLRDDEVEFDHIIPLSKGGSTEEHNLRLTCYDCNREKSGPGPSLASDTVGAQLHFGEQERRRLGAE